MDYKKAPQSNFVIQNGTETGRIVYTCVGVIASFGGKTIPERKRRRRREDPIWKPMNRPIWFYTDRRKLFHAASSNASSTWVTDIIPHERMGEGLGMYGLSMAISTAVAPALGLAMMNLLRFVCKW